MANEFPPLAALPQLTLHESIKRDQLDAPKIVADWFSSLVQNLDKPGNLPDLFLEKESWWRDFVSLSWDIACKNGSEAIAQYLSSSTAGFAEPKADQPGTLQPNLTDMGGMLFIQSGFSFKSNCGVGRGVVRLANVGPDQWKAWTVLTQLERLNGQDELELRRAKESETQPGASHVDAESNNEAEAGLQVLVIGAGQSGLALAAHLQNLGLKYLVVDALPRPGDSWRARYQTLKSHTPIYCDHYPFLKYPSSWPRWLDQEHIVKWMGHYGDILGLNIMHSTTASNMVFDESTQRYSVELQNKEGTQITSPKHIVLASGLISNIPIRPQFPGEGSFNGQLYHSGEHKSAALVPDLQNKTVTIVGAGTSAHDIAQDFVNRGAKSVTMVQRHPIFTTTPASAELFGLGLWNTPGLSTEDADLLGNSLPTPVIRTLGVGSAQMRAMQDKEVLDGMEKAGMALKRGLDGTSILDHMIVHGGRFYIDQGACEMIIDGRIKIQQCTEGVKEYYPEGIVLGNGTKVESDVVVLATGFERGDLTAERIMGKSVMSKVGQPSALDDSQERAAWWRPTAVPGLWFMTGSFLWSRQFSAILALQIGAIERGFNDQHFTAQTK